MTKPHLLALSVKRAIRHGFEADYFLADAWFGNKPTLRMTEENHLTAIVRMKKNKTNYCYTSFKNGKTQNQLLTAEELFKKAVRQQWEKIPSTPYQAKILQVALNLAQKRSDPDCWITVNLQFVREAEENSKPQPGKHDWALFLCTDTTLSPQRILEIYALRWGIEVYFKECKQNRGLLKEQTITFTSHLASISLTAIRYLMLLYVALEQDEPLSEVRTNISVGLVGLSFGQRLWGLFRCLMSNTIEQFREQLGDMADLIMSTLEESINAFFVQALQLDSFTLELEAQQSNDSSV